MFADAAPWEVDGSIVLFCPIDIAGENIRSSKIEMRRVKIVDWVIAVYVDYALIVSFNLYPIPRTVST
jgi:hypothetical protein